MTPFSYFFPFFSGEGSLEEAMLGKTAGSSLQLNKKQCGFFRATAASPPYTESYVSN